MPVNVPDYPTIFEVSDPGLKLHFVMVRMSTALPKKFPNKPWGTPLSDIVSKQNSDKFPGYVLVDFEPVQGSDDLFWIFQDLAHAREWTTKIKSKDNLTPAKFRGQVRRVETKQDVPLDTEPDDVNGDLVLSQVTQQEDKGKAVKTSATETIDENASPLLGEIYGEIVTQSTSEQLVVDGTAADSGINILNSTVTPLGNGKSVKDTKEVKGGTWPDPLDREVTKEGAAPPPPRYRKDITRTKITRKIAVGNIPTTPTLTGNEVARAYKKETPDRAEESVTTESLTLNMSSVDESIEQKPFVKIRTTMTPGTTPVVPATGNGSSQLVYEGPTSKIYENSAEVATAREGPAGSEKDKKPYVSIVTDKRYSTNNDVATTTGSANLIFNDGATLVYEISEISSTGRYGSVGVEKDRKAFVDIDTEKTYAPTSTITGNTGSSSIVYDDGTTRVFEVNNVTSTAREGPAGSEKDAKPYVAITTDKRYSVSNTVGTATGSANVVYNDGATLVYEISEVSSIGRYGPAGTEKDKKPYVELTTEKTYAPTGNVTGNSGSSNLVYDDGGTKVFEVNTTTAVARETTAGDEKDAKPYVAITTHKRYSATPNIATTTGSAQVVFNDGSTLVYEISEVESTGRYGIAGTEKDRKAFVDISTEKVYSPTSTITGNSGSSSLIYDDGGTKVFEVNNVTSTAREGPAGSEKDKKPYVAITNSKRYSASSDVATATGSANVVYNDGVTLVYEVSEIASEGRFGVAGTEKDKKVYVELTTEKSYAPTSNVTGNTGSSNLIYDDGGTKVFEVNNVTAIGRFGPAGTEKDVKPYGTFSTVKSYAPTGDITTPTGSSSMVYDDGPTKVFEKGEVTFAPTFREVGVEKDKKVGYSLDTVKSYSSAGSISAPQGSSNIQFTDGVSTVFEVGNTTLNPNPVTFIGGKTSTQLYTEDVTTEYKTSPTGSGDNYEADVAATDGTTTVFRVNSTLVTAKAPLVYTSIVHTTTPSTLLGIDINTVTRRDGRTKVLVFPNIKEGRSGSFPALVTEYFTTNAGEGASFIPPSINPAPIEYAGLLFHLSLEATLHFAITIHETIGSDDPDYFPTTVSQTFPATVPSAMPLGYVPYAFEMQPFKNGFLVRKVEINYGT